MTRRLFTSFWMAFLLAAGLAHAAVPSDDRLKGPFLIASTPYHADGSVDYDALVAEARYMDAADCTGVIWPQSNDAIDLLTAEEKCTGLRRLVAAAASFTNAVLTLGAVGLVWALVLAVLLRDTPPPAASVTDGDRPSVREALRAFFGQPAALLLTLGLGFCLYATYGFRLWIPTFLLRTFPGLTPAGAAFHAVFWFYAGAMAGVLYAGRLSDRLLPRRPAVRLETNVVGLLLMVPFVLLTAFAPNVATVCAAIFCFGLAAGVYDSNLYAALLDVVSPRYRAAAVGFFGCGGNVLGALGPGLLGGLNGLFGMRASLASLAAFACAGALVILLARRQFNLLRKEMKP